VSVIECQSIFSNIIIKLERKAFLGEKKFVILPIRKALKAFKSMSFDMSTLASTHHTYYGRTATTRNTSQRIGYAFIKLLNNKRFYIRGLNIVDDS